MWAGYLPLHTAVQLLSSDSTLFCLLSVSVPIRFWWIFFHYEHALFLAILAITSCIAFMFIAHAQDLQIRQITTISMTCCNFNSFQAFRILIFTPFHPMKPFYIQTCINSASMKQLCWFSLNSVCNSNIYYHYVACRNTWYAQRSICTKYVR